MRGGVAGFAGEGGMALTVFPNRKRWWWRGVAVSPPGTPTGFSPKARGCAAEALPRVYAQNINNPEGVVPWHHPGRLLAGARNREDGQRDDGFSIWDPTLCGAILTFVPPAQPRCGCCEPPAPTRGSAETRATPGFGAQRLWRWGGGRGEP